MEKRFAIFWILLCVLITTYLGGMIFNNKPSGELDGSTLQLQPSEGSNEELYQDLFLTLLNPTIRAAVYNYYGEYHSHDTFNIKILNIDRPDGYRTFGFVIDLEVTPFTGAHNSVGVDQLTLTIDPAGVQLIDFRHIKDYELPPSLR